jgi:hypothetical protein
VPALTPLFVVALELPLADWPSIGITPDVPALKPLVDEL